MAEAVRFLITIVSVIAPAFSKALAVSYSQFVPGNTGMRTRGFAILAAGLIRVLLSYEKASGLVFSVGIIHGYTGSSFDSHALRRVSTETEKSILSITKSSFWLKTSPITFSLPLVEPLISTMNEP